MGHFPRLLLPPGEGIVQLVPFLLNLLQTRLVLGDLSRHRFRAALLQIQLLLDAQGVFPTVAHLGVQHGSFRLPLLDFLVQRRQLTAQLLHLEVLVSHLRRQRLRLGVERLLLPGRLVPLSYGLLTVGEQLSAAHPEPFQLLQPDGDFQPSQLVPIGQKLSGFFRLDPQRLHLELQLGDFIPHAEQILLRVGQLALRLFLAVAVAGDARCLLKDVPALRAPGGENLVDFPLPDDRVALSAQAGVHKQLMDVPEPTGLAVDIVFTFAASIVAAGHHDLALLPGKPSFRIVQCQRDLRISHRFSLERTAENHVLHLAAAQRLGGLLPHDPADGVGNIRFSASVGSDHRSDRLAKGQDRLIRKGLESLELQCF